MDDAGKVPGHAELLDKMSQDGELETAFLACRRDRRQGIAKNSRNHTKRNITSVKNEDRQYKD